MAHKSPAKHRSPLYRDCCPAAAMGRGPGDLSSPPTARQPFGTPPTRASLTAACSIVGTFQYMSPEQVEGRQADARSDILAFGSVLYEMATGKKAFEAKS